MVIIFFLSAKCMCYQQPSQEEPNVIAHCSWAASSRLDWGRSLGSHDAAQTWDSEESVQDS